MSDPRRAGRDRAESPAADPNQDRSRPRRSRAVRRLQTDDPPARFDLRLVPAAAAAWAGSLAGLSASTWPTLVVFGLGSVVLGVGVRTARPAVAVGAVTALLAGWAVAALTASAARADPLVAAAVDGSWAVLDASVAGIPRPVAAGFPVADDQDRGGSPAGAGGPAGADGAAGSGVGAGPPAAGNWAVPVRVRLVQVAGRQWTPVVGFTLLGQGPGWGRLVPGAGVSAAGLLRPDPFPVLTAVSIRVRGGPVSTHPPSWWQNGAADVRRHLVEAAAGLGPDARGLLPGLVVGDTSGLPNALTTDARSTGLTHLLAVSGSHFAILGGAVVLLFRRFGPRTGAAAGAVALLVLVVVVGPQPSVLRAAVMGSITLAAMLLGRTRSALPALCAAVIGLLCWAPELAASAGFALSVQATAGLVLLAPSWSAALARRGWPPGWAGLLVIPAAAAVVTVPVIAALSGAVSLAGLPANVLVAPVVAPALILGALSAITAPWWPAGGRALARADEPLLDWIAGVAHRMARWSMATVPWPASTVGALALAALLTVLLLALRSRRLRALLLATVAGAMLVLIPAHAVAPGWPVAGWLVTACEIGQGDGMVIATGEPGSGVVVDAGPDPALISGCLDRLGITTVPLVVVTHLHADHAGGLAGVLAGRRVGAVGVGPDRTTSAWTALSGTAAAGGVPVVDLAAGTRWTSGELTLEVLGPAGAFAGTDSDENNDSVVVRGTVHGVRILMTGDIEPPAQQQLLDAGVDLRADVLEQPHHGSGKILPAFMSAVAPRVDLIGVGRGNSYGMPTPTALAEIDRVGAIVLRTDLDGDASVALVDGRLVAAVRGPVLPAVRGGPGGGD